MVLHRIWVIDTFFNEEGFYIWQLLELHSKLYCWLLSSYMEYLHLFFQPNISYWKVFGLTNTRMALNNDTILFHFQKFISWISLTLPKKGQRNFKNQVITLFVGLVWFGLVWFGLVPNQSLFGLVWFYAIPIIVGYLMPNPVFTYIPNIWFLNTFFKYTQLNNQTIFILTIQFRINWSITMYHYQFNLTSVICSNTVKGSNSSISNNSI